MTVTITWETEMEGKTMKFTQRVSGRVWECATVSECAVRVTLWLPFQGIVIRFFFIILYIYFLLYVERRGHVDAMNPRVRKCMTQSAIVSLLRNHGITVHFFHEKIITKKEKSSKINFGFFKKKKKST